MGKYLEIRDDIKGKLEAVEDVGVVHGRARMSGDWGKYLQLFKDPADDRIRGWEITRGAVRQHVAGANFRHHLFILRGHLGLNDADATDEAWQVLIDAICDAFQDARPPANASWLYQNGDAPAEAAVQVPINEIRLFGSVLCHYAEVHLSITQRIVL